MDISEDQLFHWLREANENEHLEFKEAKQQFDFSRLTKYCVALANEGGGRIILGVSDKRPRKIVGSAAFPDIQDVQRKLFSKLNFRVDVQQLSLAEGRVVVFEAPGRPSGSAYNVDGCYWMRSGEDLLPMSDDRLRTIHAEGMSTWLEDPALKGVDAAQVVSLLDTQTFFELIKLPYPTQQSAVLQRLESEQLIQQAEHGWTIFRIAALLFAKRLEDFPVEIHRKAIRVVVYDGLNKLNTKVDRVGSKGYACGFDGLVEFLHDAGPANHLVEEAIRREVKMFPKQAIRELVANALVHQDFGISGASVMIELYQDRLEISNPGHPTISIDRFIDEYRSRNERFADLMRRMGICEEKGSGVDKVIAAAEHQQLPAPDFRTGELRTTCILFAQQEFSRMSKADRVRACYQHCCLMYVSNQRMSNQSLRERFKLSEAKAATVSQVIAAALEAGQIRLDDSETTSRRYAKYLPGWA